MEYACKECNKTFSLERNLRRHMINIHKISPELLSYDESITIYKCLECSNSFKLHEDLIYHLETVHDVLIQKEELTFQNESDFINWKGKIEQEDYCKYIIFSKKSKTNEGPGISKYVCNKRGNTRTDPTKKKCAFGKNNYVTCASNIKTTLHSNGNLYVARVKTHYGHEIKNKPREKQPSSTMTKNETEITFSEPVNMDEADIMECQNINTTEQNLKNNIKSSLDIILINLDNLNNQKLDKLSFSLDSICHDLGLSPKGDKNDFFGQIIISSNSNFDHNYF